jgi:hypothetical protein
MTMDQEISSQVIELTHEMAPSSVSFDPQYSLLQATYQDELSLYRAKRTWCKTLQSSFLLEPQYDFQLRHCSSITEQIFSLQCEFTTACGRYAFWRLTNEQAPEAQYIIETAHIPNCELRAIEIAMAKDMGKIVSKKSNHNTNEHLGFSIAKDLVKKVLDNIFGCLKK